jgi:hypothetical protein
MSRAREVLGRRSVEQDAIAIETLIMAKSPSPVFNVTAPSYGATGDGTTDDTTAIQAALTAADSSGGTVYFPQGTYVVQALTATKDVTLEFSPGAILSIGEYSIRETTYQWTAAASGTSNYYLEASGGGDPGITLPTYIYENNSEMTRVLLTFNDPQPDLAAGEYYIGDRDSLGYETVYVRLSDSTDPDGKAVGYVEAGYTVTVNGGLVAGPHQIFSGNGAALLNPAKEMAVRPEWWGAVADGDFSISADTGQTDSTAALQRCFDSLLTNDSLTSGGRVVLDGRYLSGPLYIPTYGTTSSLKPQGRITIEGKGVTASGIKLKASQDDNLLTLAGSMHRFSNFQLNGNRDGQSSAGITLKMVDTSNNQVVLKDMRVVEGYDYCMWSSGSGQTFLQNVVIDQGDIGLRLAGGSRQFVMVDSTVQNCDTGGIEIVGGQLYMNVVLYGCYLEGNGPGTDAGTPYHVDISSFQHGDVERYVIGGDWSWTLSGSGTNEYYLRTNASANPTFPSPVGVVENGTAMSAGSLGSLAAGEYAFGNNDSLGYSTLYVRLTDSTDPDSKTEKYLDVESGTNILHVYDTYFHGVQDEDTHIGVVIDSVSQVGGFVCRNNWFRDCGGGAFKITGHAAREVGMNNDCRGNSYMGTTPRPTIGVTNRDFFGYKFTDHCATEFVSEEIDLSVAHTSTTVIPLVPFPDRHWLRIQRIDIVWTVAASGSSNIDIGTDADFDRFVDNYAISGSEAQFDAEKLPLKLTWSKTNADGMMQFRNTAATAGKIKVRVKYFDYGNQFYSLG